MGFFETSDWENDLLKHGTNIPQREYSSQMLEYLINLTPSQLCYPEAFYCQQIFTDDNNKLTEKEESIAKKPRSGYAVDNTPINTGKSLTPEMMQYLQGIAQNFDDDDSKYTIYLKNYISFPTFNIG